uniref:Uncharacterized protein TCIL3000_5_3030 n=1 Tax=Trypanosoma congolense (strain IL3000) TaxID=1068625 RepID=G0ULS2_TRYCI|nr:unnamed protein product [Trypanosoma congolense IL3000]
MMRPASTNCRLHTTLNPAFVPICCSHRSFVRVSYAAEEHKNQHNEKRYQTLGEYLQRLPRGLRDVLLWSPALAAAYFMFYKQPAYYLPSTRRRLLSRPLISNVERDADGTTAAKAAQIQLDCSPGAVVEGFVLAVTGGQKGDGVTSPLFEPPVLPFSVGSDESMALAMRLQPLRDPGTGKLMGYKLA